MVFNFNFTINDLVVALNVSTTKTKINYIYNITEYRLNVWPVPTQR